MTEGRDPIGWLCDEFAQDPGLAHLVAETPKGRRFRWNLLDRALSRDLAEPVWRGLAANGLIPASFLDSPAWSFRRLTR